MTFNNSSANLGFFLNRTRNAKKVMVLDLGLLGDTIHLLPALWMVRQAYPQAQLHATVAAHVTSILECVPWVDRPCGYMRYPRRSTLRENLKFISQMRSEKFDVVINLNGSDRSSWLTYFSGAAERLGRLPEDGGPPFWKRMFTSYVYQKFADEPVYLQHCLRLQQAGFSFTQPEFHTTIKPEHLIAAQITEQDRGTYFHISPFTTAIYKELSPKQLGELVGALSKEFPDKKIVLSCAPIASELIKMEELLPHLPFKPWRLFDGNLNLTQLASVISHSAAHFCGDTGTLHLALMTNTPTVAWFWPNPNMKEWFPVGDRYQVVVGTNTSRSEFIGNIETESLVFATSSVMKAAEL